MQNISKTPGGWKSRTLWSFLILCVLSLIFLGAWVWAVHYAGERSFELAMDNKKVPPLFNTIVQAFPLGAIASGVGAAAVALIGGNKARDATRNLGKNGGMEK
jgi:ABC-type Fe3+ transport system permease subunit